MICGISTGKSTSCQEHNKSPKFDWWYCLIRAPWRCSIIMTHACSSAFLWSTGQVAKTRTKLTQTDMPYRLTYPRLLRHYHMQGFYRLSGNDITALTVKCKEYTVRTLKAINYYGVHSLRQRCLLRISRFAGIKWQLIGLGLGKFDILPSEMYLLSRSANRSFDWNQRFCVDWTV